MVQRSRVISEGARKGARRRPARNTVLGDEWGKLRHPAFMDTRKVHYPSTGPDSRGHQPTTATTFALNARKPTLPEIQIPR
jgi:hypothetical protein